MLSTVLQTPMSGYQLPEPTLVESTLVLDRLLVSPQIIRDFHETKYLVHENLELFVDSPIIRDFHETKYLVQIA